MQSPHGTLVPRDRRQPLGKIRRDLRFGERIEHDLLAKTVQAKLVPQGIERMIARDDLGEPEGRQPHDAGTATPTCDVVDELNRRPIGPVQVFGDEQERFVLRLAIEKLAHFAEHALGRCADELIAQRFALFSSADPRQLQQPRRRDRS